MHGFEVGGVFLDDLFEVGPLLEHHSIFAGAGCVVLLDEFIELSVEQLDFLLCAFVDFGIPVHCYLINIHLLV